MSLIFLVMSLSFWSVTPALTTKALIVMVHINGTLTKFLIDTGASMNILARRDYNNMCNKAELKNNSVIIYAYGSKWILTIQVFFKADIQFKDTRINSTL